MLIKKPLLAETAEVLADIPLPCFASFKLDGIRCIKQGTALSRKFLPIPNVFIRTWIEQNLPDGIDGEIITVNPDGSPKDFNSIQSDVMKEIGEPDFRFAAFDYVKEDLLDSFHKRQNDLLKYFHEEATNEVRERLFIVHQEYIADMKHLEAFEQLAFSMKQEGIMTRDPGGKYKCNRSTLNEAILLKYKRWVDEEGVVIGFKEQMTNTNEKTTNELGDSKRSKKKSGLVPANTLGALIVRRKNGQVFDLGTGEGLTQEVRKEIWDNQGKHLNQFVTFKHQVSPNDPPDMKPRFPGWKGFRHPNDMSE